MHSLGLFRDIPNVKDIDMLHAENYSEMDLKELKAKTKERKGKDNSLQSSMM